MVIMSSNRIYKTEDDGKCPRCGSSEVCFERYYDYDNVVKYYCEECDKEFYKRYKKVLDVVFYNTED